MGRTAFVRERILEAAFDCFARQGYEAVSSRDIARAAKVGAASMYKHFTSMEELAKEVYRIGLAPIIEAVTDIEKTHNAHDTHNTHNAIRAVCDLLYCMYDQRPRALALLIFPPHEFTPWELAKRNKKSPRSTLLRLLNKDTWHESIVWGAIVGPLQDRYHKRLTGEMKKHSAITQQYILRLLTQSPSR